MRADVHYFVIPGLFHLSATDLAFISDEQYPNLSRFIKSSKRLKTSTLDLDGVLCEQLAYSSKALPMVQHFKNDKNILIATPILLKVDLNSTWIQAALDAENMHKIIYDMAEFFAQDLSIIEQYDQHFIIQFKNTDVVNHLPNYLSVLGKKIDLYQASIRDNLAWFKLVNEIQMYLHGHLLNKTKSGQQLLNSLWFWGGDSSQTVKHTKYIRSDDALMQLALSNGSDALHDRLIIKTDLIKYLKLNSDLQLEAFFYQLEQELKGLNLNTVCIDTADGHKLLYSRFKKFKFWHSKPTLIKFLTYQFNKPL